MNLKAFIPALVALGIHLQLHGQESFSRRDENILNKLLVKDVRTTKTSMVFAILTSVQNFWLLWYYDLVT